MSVYHSFVLIFAILACLTHCQVMSSPEAEPTEPGLYLYTAGVTPRYVMPIMDGTNICPDDYPTGFNIRCISEARYVRFFLNGNRFMTEYHAPFYMSGDVRGRVRPLTGLPSVAHIRCKGFRPKTNSAASGVTFRC